MIRERIMALPNVTRFIMGTAMFDAARTTILASLPKDISDHELKRRLFERIYGKAFPS